MRLHQLVGGMDDHMPDVMKVDFATALATLCAVVAGYYFVYLGWGLWNFFRPYLASLNPFRRPLLVDTTFVAPRKPRTLNVEEREEIFREEFAEEKIPSNVDVILIGGGISSLTAAVFLARGGKKVVVLEQHSRQAGGSAGTWTKVGGVEFNAGWHFMLNAGVTDHINGRNIFDQVTAGAISWVDLPEEMFSLEPLPSLAKTEVEEGAGETAEAGSGGGGAAPVASSAAGSKVTKPIKFRTGSLEKWKEEAINAFPDERRAIERFASTCSSVARGTWLSLILVKFLPFKLVWFLVNMRLFRWLNSWERWNNTSFREYLKDLTDNEQLKTFLSTALTYGLPDPEGHSLAYAGFYHDFFVHGWSYPVGEAVEIEYQMMKQIRDLGGRIFANAEVDHIVLDGKGERATGVAVQGPNRSGTSGGSESGHIVKIHAPHVVSSAGVWNTYKKMLPYSIVEKYPAMRHCLEQLTDPTGASCMAVFISLNGSAEELGLDARDHFYLPMSEEARQAGWKMELEDFLNDPEAESEPVRGLPFYFVGFPSVRDPTFRKKFPGKSGCWIWAGIPWDWFAKFGAEEIPDLEKDSEHVKLEKDIGDRLVRFALKRFPQLEGKIVATQAVSPARWGSVLGLYAGRFMGLEVNKERFSLKAQSTLRPSTGLKGFYMTGQDVLLPGAPTAALTGVWVASEILGRSIALEMELKGRLGEPRKPLTPV